jgi:hypothetical protein
MPNGVLLRAPVILEERVEWFLQLTELIQAAEVVAAITRLVLRFGRALSRGDGSVRTAI